MDRRPYFHSQLYPLSTNLYLPTCGNIGTCCDMGALLAIQDPHAVSVFLQNRFANVSSSAPVAQQLAVEIAKDPTFHKYVVSSAFKSSTPVEHYVSTLYWLSLHAPIHQPLIELGIFDILFDLLTIPEKLKVPLVGQTINHFLASSACILTAQNINSLLQKLFLSATDCWIMDKVLKMQPQYTTLVAEQLLLQLQSPVNPAMVSYVLVPALADPLIQLGAIDILCNLPNSPPAAIAALYCLKFNSWTPQHARVLVRHLLAGSGYNIVDILNTLQGEDFSAAISEELCEQFPQSSLTEAQIKPLQRALQYNRTKELLTQLGLLDITASSPSSATLASSIPEYMDFLVTNPNRTKIIHLIQHLITTNNLTQLASVVGDLKKRMTLSEVLTNDVCATVVKQGVPTENLPRDMQDAMLAYFRIPPISRDKQAPWYIDAALLPTVDTQRKYISIPGQSKDLELVTTLYQHSPVPGYDIKGISIVYSENLFNSFVARVGALQARSGKEVFAPHWKNNNRLSQEEITHRQRVMDLFRSLSGHKYSMAPDVSFVLSWHGTRQSVLESLFSTGFANLASTDAGFFGKGLYTTPDAEYAFRVYSSGALLLNWVAAFSPFPVIAQDEPELAEKGNFQNYDAHFVPVYSPNHPKTTAYHACESNQEPQYSELVVFESSQMLAHYIVELQPTMPREVSFALEEGNKVASAASKKSGLAAWTVGDVCKWFASLQLTQDYSALLRDNGINGEVLMTMTQQDWKALGMNHFGDSRTVATKVSRLEM